MEESRVQQQAADTILERGVRFQIPAPFYLRIFGKKMAEIVVYRPKMGTLIAMSKISAELNEDLAKLSDGSFTEAYALVEKHGDKLLKWLAIAMLNNKYKIELRGDSLANKLKWRITAQEAATLFYLIVMLSGVKDFTNTIRFLNSMNLMERKEMSPKDQGS
jgi:hypothetical protein